jgi:hypothetical protein
MRLGIAEVLELASKEKTKQEKIAVLHKNDIPALRTILKYTFDPNIKWLLPKGKIEFTPNGLTEQETVLNAEARRLYLFVEGGHGNLKQAKREWLFRLLLENVDPADAALLIAIKDKKMPYKGITKALVEEAYPGLIEEEQIKANVDEQV